MENTLNSEKSIKTEHTPRLIIEQHEKMVQYALYFYPRKVWLATHPRGLSLSR
jgi:hypothetical protein